MTDRNPMQQGNQNPISVVGAIPGKGFLDLDLIDEWQANARNPVRALGCYPDGKDDINHDAMPGDSAYGLKGVRNMAGMDGEATELSVVSVAGLSWDDYCSQEAMEEKFYWQGVVTTESRLTNPLDSTTSDPPHGFATLKAGTHSVINNGHKTIYAGDRVCWQFPRAPFHPKGDGRTFNGGSEINQLARQGVPTGQFRPEYVPFDPLDFDCQTSGAFASIISPKSLGGVSDMGFINALPNIHLWPQERPWSNTQDMGNALKYGVAGIGLSFVQTLLRKGLIQIGTGVPLEDNSAGAVAIQLSEQIGLWDTDAANQGILIECLADVFLRGINAGDEHRVAAEARYKAEFEVQDFRDVAFSEPDPNNTGDMYKRLRLHLTDVLLQGITRSWWSKTSKIVGTALNSSAPGDTAHFLFGHHAC